MNVLHPYSSVFPHSLSNCVKVGVTLNLTRIFAENVFGVEWEKLEVHSSKCKPHSEPGLFHIHCWRRLISGPTGDDAAGTVDVHTQAKTCRASQPGHYLVHITR